MTGIRKENVSRNEDERKCERGQETECKNIFRTSLFSDNSAIFNPIILRKKAIY